MKNVAITNGAFSNSILRRVVKSENKGQIITEKKNLDSFDVVIFSGGSDINPTIYNEENVYSYISKFSKARDEFELSILKEIIGNHRWKIIGICRGHQLINAFLGGKLVQEISNIKRHKGVHELKHPTGIVGKFFKSVNSIHHQGVLKEGNNLKITSRYGGVIESTENSQIISVQWHPEVMEDDSGAQDFFNYLLNKWE